MSHLHTLYKHRRTAKKEQQEDFLTAALVWLLQQDQQACWLFLETLGVAAPSDLSRRRVLTQVYLAGSRDRPDLVLHALSHGAQWTLYVECKLGLAVTPGVVDQVRRYEALSGHTCALLVHEDKLSAAKKGKLTTGLKAGTWQAFVTKLRDASLRVDPSAVLPLRTEFIALTERFDVHPEPLALTDAELTRAVSGLKGVSEVTGRLKQMLQAWVPQKNSSKWTWEDEGALGGGWAREGGEHGSKPVLGFGVAGTAERVGEHAIVRWVAWICLSRAASKACAAALNDNWDYFDAGWWTLELEPTLHPDESVDQALMKTMTALRSVMSELGLEVDVEPELPSPSIPVPLLRYARVLAEAAAVREQLRTTVQAFRPHLFEALRERLGEAVRLPKRGRRKVDIDGVGGVREVASWSKLDEDGAVVRLWLWLGGKARLEKVEPSLIALTERLGCTYERSTHHKYVSHINLPVSPAEDLPERMERLAAPLAMWFWQHREALELKAP